MEQENELKEKTTKEVDIILLKDLKNILDVTILRGVLRPSELTPVGKIYDSLVEILKN